MSTSPHNAFPAPIPPDHRSVVRASVLRGKPVSSVAVLPVRPEVSNVVPKVSLDGISLSYKTNSKGHLVALERGQPGHRYILGGENLTLKQILDKLGDITGLPSPKLKLPYIFAFATGVIDETITGRMLNKEPRATIDAVRMGKKMMFVTSAKAERELGWRIVPVNDALRRAVEWFRANEYV